MPTERILLAVASRAACIGLVMAALPPCAKAQTNSPARGLFDLRTTAFSHSQPPPRRYGRPSYSDKNSNPDGSPKYTYFAGVGAGLPVGNTHAYETPGYSFQVGGGRNFNQSLGVMLQFDYDHFGLQAKTLTNQEFIYNYCPQAVCTAPITNLDGNNHAWSFTLNPKFTLPSKGPLGAFVVIGGGFYHKVTNFTQPTTAEQCGTFGCQFYSVDSSVAHYTSNAGGMNGGIGFTVRMSEFSTRQLYLEARYVLMLNQQRQGYTAQNVATTTYTGYDAYPANSHRTTYIPIKLGFRF
jgi:hypothetical protein